MQAGSIGAAGRAAWTTTTGVARQTGQGAGHIVPPVAARYRCVAAGHAGEKIDSPSHDTRRPYQRRSTRRDLQRPVRASVGRRGLDLPGLGAPADDSESCPLAHRHPAAEPAALPARAASVGGRVHQVSVGQAIQARHDAGGGEGLPRLPRGAYQLARDQRVPLPRCRHLVSHAAASQPDARPPGDTDVADRRRVAPAASHPSSMAEYAFCRQPPKVGAECARRACSDVRGRPAMGGPIAIAAR